MTDAVALVHTFGGVRTINGMPGAGSVVGAPGSAVRVRVINTDPGPMPVWVSGGGFRLVAVDGRDLNGGNEIRDRAVLVTAGGRADLEVRVPASGGVRVQVAGASLVVGATGSTEAPSTTAPRAQLDLLTYGTATPLSFDPEQPTRTFDYAIGRRFGLLDGRPGNWWTINGHPYPDVPMFMVQPGDFVRFRISNDSGEVHPMHLHGHHVLVLSRGGIPATGARWWVDSLNVDHGERYEVALVADNPGIWMDHCHNLPHARDGLVAHLMYAGYTTPFVLGGDHAMSRSDGPQRLRLVRSRPRRSADRKPNHNDIRRIDMDTRRLPRREMAAGAVVGLAWASAMRAMMAEIAATDPGGSSFSVATFIFMLPPGAVLGALMGWALAPPRPGTTPPPEVSSGHL